MVPEVGEYWSANCHEDRKMTYGLAIRVEDGLVFCSDSRTSAGTDHINVYSKMHTFAYPGKRFFCLLSAGNLATTQAVLQRLRSDIAQPGQSLWTVPTLSAAADYIGLISADVQRNQSSRDSASTVFEATFILGGQIQRGETGIYLVYPQGNYIHESAEHPFLQVGEIKYGKPILDRVVHSGLSLETAGRCALVSMNSTIRSNLTVGAPVELLFYRNGSLEPWNYLNLEEDDIFYRSIADSWSQGLTRAMDALPMFPWEQKNSPA